jgi:hypothetical protein
MLIRLPSLRPRPKRRAPGVAGARQASQVSLFVPSPGGLSSGRGIAKRWRPARTYVCTISAPSHRRVPGVIHRFARRPVLPVRAQRGCHRATPRSRALPAARGGLRSAERLPVFTVRTKVCRVIRLYSKRRASQAAGLRGGTAQHAAASARGRKPRRPATSSARLASLWPLPATGDVSSGSFLVSAGRGFEPRPPRCLLPGRHVQPLAADRRADWPCWRGRWRCASIACRHDSRPASAACELSTSAAGRWRSPPAPYSSRPPSPGLSP